MINERDYLEEKHLQDCTEEELLAEELWAEVDERMAFGESLHSALFSVFLGEEGGNE